MEILSRYYYPSPVFIYPFLNYIYGIYTIEFKKPDPIGKPDLIELQRLIVVGLEGVIQNVLRFSEAI